MSWTRTETTMDFVMTGRTTGTLALGLTDTPGKMFPADNIMCWVDDATGVAHVEDGFMSSYAAPSTAGDVQSVTLLSASQVGGVTTCELTRALATNDNLDRNIHSGNMDIVWAMAPQDDPSAMHTKRGR